MSGQDQSGLEWRPGNLPVSTRFCDPYFSLDGGLDEARHVFLGGNDLPARLNASFAVAELGFGTGLNMLALALACQRANCPGPVHFSSFEAYPLPAEAVRRAISTFPEALAIAAPYLAAWAAGARRFQLGALRVEIIEGDVRDTLPCWQGRANAWFLDGFSPARNPEMWAPELMAQVARHTAHGGTFATYTAAGFVRRGLQEAGFEVTRQPGYGRKRHMSAGRLEIAP